MNNKMDTDTDDDDDGDWLEETADELARRIEMIKIEEFLKKTQIVIEENEKTAVHVRHVKFVTKVEIRVVSRLPQNLWYSYQEYTDMRTDMRQD